MSILEAMEIDLKALSEGHTHFAHELDGAYFEALDAQDISDGTVSVELDVQRTGDVYVVDIHVDGTVTVACDRCLDPMDQPIENDSRVSVVFGDEPESDDDVVVVSEADGMLDTSWLIYEQIALAIPIKHVHAPGKCNVAMTKKFEELSTARSSDEGETAVDPRWSALQQLTNNDKQ